MSGARGLCLEPERGLVGGPGRVYQDTASTSTLCCHHVAAPAGSCKIYVLDAAAEFGPLVGAPICDVNSPFIWPFASPGRGIDAADTLQHQDSQYGAGHWISQVCGGSTGSWGLAGCLDVWLASSMVEAWAAQTPFPVVGMSHWQGCKACGSAGCVPAGTTGWRSGPR
jgi:hypothetical protein